MNKIGSLVPIDGQRAFCKIAEYILGGKYYIVDPLSRDQANAVMLEDIKDKYDRLNNTKFKKAWNKLIDKLKFDS